MPTRQQELQRRMIDSASSSVMSFRLLNLIKSSREVMTSGRFDTVKTVEPCDENVVATGWSNPLIIVTTAMTAEAPTNMPTSVSSVRILFERRLPPATRNDSHKDDNVTRRRGDAGMYLLSPRPRVTASPRLFIEFFRPSRSARRVWR